MNVRQAFFASRGEPDARELLDVIAETVMCEPEDGRRADAGTELIDLPLSLEEEEWLYESLKASKHPGATDTLIMRKIAMGKGADAIGTEGRLRGHKVGGLDWHILARDVGKAGG